MKLNENSRSRGNQITIPGGGRYEYILELHIKGKKLLPFLLTIDQK